MPPVDRALCRMAAKECTELASVTSDPETRQLLLMRAQEWLKLAYSDSEEQLDQLLSKFNSEQLGGSSDGDKKERRLDPAAVEKLGDEFRECILIFWAHGSVLGDWSNRRCHALGDLGLLR